jgi:hypothetical protein
MTDKTEAIGRIRVYGREFRTIGRQWSGKVEKTCPAAAKSAGGDNGFESFAAQGPAQNIFRPFPASGLHRLPFHTDIHAETPGHAFLPLLLWFQIPPAAQKLN